MEDKELNRKIVGALSSIDGISQVDPAPFFYTRVKAKLDQRLASSHYFSQPLWLRWLVQKQQWVAFGAITLVMLNVGLIFSENLFNDELELLQENEIEWSLMDEEQEFSFSYSYLYDE